MSITATFLEFDCALTDQDFAYDTGLPAPTTSRWLTVGDETVCNGLQGRAVTTLAYYPSDQLVREHLWRPYTFTPRLLGSERSFGSLADLGSFILGDTRNNHQLQAIVRIRTIEVPVANVDRARVIAI
nr:hypothetical protein [Rhodococcus sp. MEB041]